MNPRERGFLLLTCRMGDPQRPVLTVPQLRMLAQRVKSLEPPKDPDRELTQTDLVKLGLDRELAGRICALLAEEERLKAYLKAGEKQGCAPITRVSPKYPLVLRKRLGLEAPGCLWALGDVSLLNTPGISLVGSRELMAPNRKFARAVGERAAEQGLTLISGNARGADMAAQEASLEAGGRVISIVADELTRYPIRPDQLFLSEDGYDEPFTAQRALSRNRCIHAMGAVVFSAQSELGKGGTWDGCRKNLRNGWSPVACFRDGSESASELEKLGAYLVSIEDLRDFQISEEEPITFFDT